MQCTDSLDSVYMAPSDLPPYAASHRGDIVRCAKDRTFSVGQIETRLAADGFGLVGGIGQYEHIWRMAYVRGPEGIIVALAQRID